MNKNAPGSTYFEVLKFQVRNLCASAGGGIPTPTGGAGFTTGSPATGGPATSGVVRQFYTRHKH